MSKHKSGARSSHGLPRTGLIRSDFFHLAGALSVILAFVSSGVPYVGRRQSLEFQRQPTKARSAIEGHVFSLSNDTIAAVWEISGGKLRALEVVDQLTVKKIPVSESAFAIILRDGTVINASGLHVVTGPKVENLIGDPRAARFSDRLGGQQITVLLEDKAGSFQVLWHAILRDGSTYIMQEITLQAKSGDLPVREIRLIDLSIAGAQVSGSVKGSPVVAGNMFFGFEHPLSTCSVSGERARCNLYRQLPLKAGQSMTYSSVIGVTPAGQLRRGFLNYLERERAHPYRTFLHYNSWYDLGYFTKYGEADALEVIETFGRELNKKRGVTLSSFLYDDGWDDPMTLWKFNSGFPNGFTPLKITAAKYRAAPGLWLSPWGGYGKPKQERLKYGEREGFEVRNGGFALSGPKYYRYFSDTCLEMIRKYGINQFKFDGTGNANQVIPGSQFGSDFDAAINLIDELRAEKPDLFINLTTGTFPSPFWLRYADSIWRGGEDHDFTGVGTDRQRWITYRDAETFQNIVRAGPLYPLNSLMLHGLIFARYANKLATDPNGDFGDEVRSYFGSGTQLQEMYITGSLLSQKDWDLLAEAANWSHLNASTLVDTHWVGGDPAKLEIYGWASWSPAKGILVLRNPSDKAQAFSVDVQSVFELPANAARCYGAHSPWQKDRGQPSTEMCAGQINTFQLKPFQVLTLEAVPGNR